MTNTEFLPILGGGPFGVQPGQYTDDSELALGIWYCLLTEKKYSVSSIAKIFFAWYESDPFDIGNATRGAFCDGDSYQKMKNNAINHNKESLSNGCLMKISPIGALGLLDISTDLVKCAREICELTNPNPVCVDVTVAYVMAIDTALKTGNPEESYNNAKSFTRLKLTWKLLEEAKTSTSPTILNTTTGAKLIPADGQHQGYVGIAFQNAFYQLLNVTPANGGFYKVIVDTISLGGDTDTNACIAGALYGACYGYSNIPKDWVNKVKCFEQSNERNYLPLNHNYLFETLKMLNK